MSDHSHTPEPKAEYFNPQKAGALPLIFAGVGAIGLILSAILGLFDHQQFAFSWLFATVYFFTICVGALFWTLVHHATDAEWSVVVRRQLENVATLIPIVGVFFGVTIWFTAPMLYTWWNIPPAANELLMKKSPFLNHTGFFVRAAIYFCALSFLAFRMYRNSVAQDEDGHPKYTISNRRWSFAGIPILGLSLTFGAVDWLMALDFHWASTMWGVYIFAGGVGSAMALLVLIIFFLKKTGHMDFINTEHYHVMGKFMLAFTVFWAYIGFSQYMLIWYANMPEETAYFIRRNTDTWWYFSTLLVVGRFFLPFPFLLFQGTKRNPQYLVLVAGWILVMQALDIYVIILPMLHQHGVAPALLDISSVVGIGGTLGFFFMRKLPKTSLYPIRDPRIQESLNLSN